MALLKKWELDPEQPQGTASSDGQVMGLFLHYLSLPYLLEGIEFTLQVTALGLARRADPGAGPRGDAAQPVLRAGWHSPAATPSSSAARR